ncbi:hypothetical protein EB077_11060, partial [bacterium]|nr:hypothetical protein [bacterium]
MGNLYRRYTERDVILDALQSKELIAKKEDNGIRVIFKYDFIYNCLLIVWYSDALGPFDLGDLGVPTNDSQ